jgi:hypothetical protein
MTSNSVTFLDQPTGSSSDVPLHGTGAESNEAQTHAPQVAQPRPVPETVQAIGEPLFRQRAIDAWRAASQLCRLIDQWYQWFGHLERTGDADPGLAMRMAEAVAVCVRALCALGVNMPTFSRTPFGELIKRFPHEPWALLEEPALRDPRCREEFVEALRRDDLLDDEECRNRIRALTQGEGWLDDLPSRRRVGELLQEGKWGEPHRAYLQRCLGSMLQSVAWQQSEDYRRRTRELLQASDPATLGPKPYSLGELQGELLGFLMMLETAPSVALSVPGPPRAESQSRNGPEGGQQLEQPTFAPKRVLNEPRTEESGAGLATEPRADAAGQGERAEKAASAHDLTGTERPECDPDLPTSGTGTAEERVRQYLDTSPNPGMAEARRITALTERKIRRTQAWKDYEEEALNAYLLKHPAASGKDVECAFGFSPAKTAGMKAWTAHMERTRASKPPRKVKERPLKDATVRARPDVRAVDPSKPVDQRDSIFQAVVEFADSDTRAALNRLSSPERDALVEHILNNSESDSQEWQGRENARALILEIAKSWLEDHEQEVREGNRKRRQG